MIKDTMLQWGRAALSELASQAAPVEPVADADPFSRCLLTDLARSWDHNFHVRRAPQRPPRVPCALCPS